MFKIGKKKKSAMHCMILCLEFEVYYRTGFCQHFSMYLIRDLHFYLSSFGLKSLTVNYQD